MRKYAHRVSMLFVPKSINRETNVLLRKETNLRQFRDMVSISNDLRR